MRKVNGCVSRRQKKGKKGGRITVWVARVAFRDPTTGKRREITRHASTQAAAKELLPSLLREAGVDAPRDYRRRTFADLAHFYREQYAVPPQMIDGREVAGIVSWKNVRQIVDDVLVPHFGPRLVSSITWGEVRQFRNERFAVPTRRGKRRSVRRVNDELSKLRHMLNVAVDEGWIAANPMSALRGGRARRDPLIRPRDENRRTRVLTREEEERLLAACTGKRASLRPVLILALDTGMRRGEIQKMKWRNVHMDRGVIEIPAADAKSRRARIVPITARVREELDQLRTKGVAPDETPFALDWKRAFAAARKAAGIGPDFVFHSTRHTAATRLTAAGISSLEVAQLIGHSALEMTAAYVHATDELLRRAATALDRHAESENPKFLGQNIFEDPAVLSWTASPACAPSAAAEVR